MLYNTNRLVSGDRFAPHPCACSARVCRRRRRRLLLVAGVVMVDGVIDAHDRVLGVTLDVWNTMMVLFHRLRGRGLLGGSVSIFVEKR